MAVQWVVSCCAGWVVIAGTIHEAASLVTPMLSGGWIRHPTLLRSADRSIQSPPADGGHLPTVLHLTRPHFTGTPSRSVPSAA